MKPKDIDPIVYAIYQWEDIIQDPSMVNIPHALDGPLPIIDIHTNGMMCQQAPKTCRYITTHMNTMRKHWKQAHRWTQTNHHGRVVGAKKAQGEAELQQSFWLVIWQRVFPNRIGSHLVHIQSHDPQPEEQARTAPTAHIQATVNAVIQAWEQAQAQAKADQAIQASQITDANPWLRMTRWAEYLQGIQAHDLLACVAAPEEDPMDAMEQRVQVIWHTMEQVARKSQQTVQQCGQAIRVEAVRSEKGQTPYRPLSHRGLAIVLDTDIGFSPERFSGSGNRVGTDF
ncbi:hypothetical protein CNMCM7691_004919 [Aspergillus felis]|uniref:Uncharacterized protein n=1 Tax=Aspergillus felis TaxID=1287682 RepID=A0A8H6R497_9EURO|nr:hypothetical protein CNMCM7691_004919 [Aspergillus felis]